MARTAVVAGTATVVAGKVSSNQQQKAQTAAEAQAYEQQQLAAQQQAQAAAMAPPPAAPAPASGLSPDAIAQLQQLASLKDQGILTEEEFAAQKAKILGM
jgi:hypothetical protein